MSPARHDPERIRRLLARPERLRLTWRELSDQSNVPLSTLQFWARRLASQSSDARRSVRRPFVELSGTPETTAASAMEILLTNGRRLRVPADCDLEVALRWVRLLETTC